MRFKTFLGRIIPCEDNGDFASIEAIGVLKAQIDIIYDKMSRGYSMRDVLNEWGANELRSLQASSKIKLFNEMIFDYSTLGNLSYKIFKPLNPCVYLLSYIDDDEVVKIGCTENLKHRMQAHFQRPNQERMIQLHMAITNQEYKKLEKLCHQFFEEYRINRSEFFAITPHLIIDTLVELLEANHESIHN